MTVTTKSYEYLEKRGINPGTIEQATTAGNIELTDRAVIARYQHIKGENSLIQYLNLDGAKLFEKGCKPSEPYFFHCGERIKDADKIVVTEGVFDALSVVDAMPGVAVLAIGGSTLYRKIEVLPHKEKIVLAFDNDEAGRAATQNTIELLDGAYIIPWGVKDPKDINDLLKDGKRDRIKQLIDCAEWVEPEVFEREPEQSADTEAPAETTNSIMNNIITGEKFKACLEQTINLEFTIKKVWPEIARLAVIYGKPGDFKTFLCCDATFAIAAGMSWHGHETKHKKILYVAAEGQAGFLTRWQVWQNYHKQDVSDNFILYPKAILLDDDSHIKEFREALELLKPGVIAFDTLSRCMAGDENSVKDMMKVINSLVELSQDFDTQILLIHHSGKDGSRGARGSTALLGAADVVMRTEKVGDKQVILQCEKMKDAEPFNEMGFYLETASTGYADKHGNFINSLVPAYDPLIKKGVKMSKPATIAVNTLQDLGGKAQINDWKDNCYLNGISEGGKDAKRKAFQRAMDILQDAGKIKVEGDNVTLL